MTPTQTKVLKALDESIEKWQKVTYEFAHPTNLECSLCNVCNCVITIRTIKALRLVCPIYIYTKTHNCFKTSFYTTSVYKLRNYLKQEIKPALIRNYTHANNQMLLLLHEIRKAYITNPDEFIDPEL